jgi:galactokinase
MSYREATRTLQVPARINILGEHVDYVSYRPTSSLTFGSDKHRMTMRLTPRRDREVRGESGSHDFAPFSFEMDTLPASHSWREAISSAPLLTSHWSNYVRGAVAFALLKHGSSIERGFDFFVESNIPSAGGASSSSALTVLAGAAIRLVNEIEVDREQLARDSAQAEWFTGTRGGDMDHLTICLAKDGHAVHLDYSDSSWRWIELPGEETRWITAFSHPANKGAEVMLEYNERAVVSRIIIPALLERTQSVEDLPESLDLASFGALCPGEMEQCRQLFPVLCSERSAKQLRIRDMALHHRAEADRVRRAVAALDASSQGQAQIPWTMLGELLDESHASLRDQYAVSTPGVEHLRTLIRAVPGVYGARLMGGGFGGNVLALVSAPAAPELVDRLRKDYYDQQGRDADAERAIMVSTPGPGLLL